MLNHQYHSLWSVPDERFSINSPNTIFNQFDYCKTEVTTYYEEDLLMDVASQNYESLQEAQLSLMMLVPN